jgi:protein-disulfide isomerase
VKFKKILLTSALLTFSGLSQLAMADTAQSTQFSADQVKQIQQIVHDYLVNNPKVLIEASQALQKQEIAKVEQKAKSSISENANQIFADPASPVTGNAQGDVTVVEFFDYQCPHCKDMGPVVDNLSKNDSNLRVVLKELPIFGGNSKDVSMLALAAMQQGADKYAKFHAALLAAPNPLSKEKALELAKTVGLDTDKLSKDMNSDAVKKQIDDNFKLAQSLGLMGTPTLVVSKWQVNGKDNSAFVKQATFIPGVVDEASLKEIIAQTRKS